jgi:FkbM family methyltransferase
MERTFSFSSIAKKLFFVVILLLFLSGILLVARSIRAGYGCKYFSIRSKGLVTYFVHRDQGFFKPLELIGVYTKLAIKPLFCRRRADKEKLMTEHMLGFDVNFYNYDEQVLVFGEVFIEECYYFVSKKPDPFILDCGGNIGLGTLYFKALYPQATILVFEPDPCNFATLQKNIEMNHLANVTAFNVAVSNKQGVCSFRIDYKGATSGHVLSDNAQDKNQITVKRDLLSAYINKKPVDLLKLDVEGSEGEVFEDLEKTRSFPYIREMFVEFHSGGSATLGKLLSTLDKNNFGYNVKQGQTLMIHAFNRTPIEA